MRRSILCSAAALTALASSAAPTLAASNQVSICHATASTTNPYVLIHPAAAGVVNGHLGHQDARDVVAPFTYKGTTYSQNWDADGQALMANGCSVPDGPVDGGGGGGSF